MPERTGDPRAPANTPGQASGERHRLTATGQSDSIALMTDHRANDAHVETALGLCAFRGTRSINTGAGAGEGVLAVAEGSGGHGCGWLAARLTVRALVDQRGTPCEKARFVGAAGDTPDVFRWMGGMIADRDGEARYRDWVAESEDRAAPPGDLKGLFSRIDKFLAGTRVGDRTVPLMAGCTAAVLDGCRIRGAHAGIGRALVLRAGANRFESLVTQHWLHLVLHRTPMAARAEGLDLETLPRNVIANSLGTLEPAGVGIDEFEMDLGLGDLLLLSSQGFDLSDDELAEIARKLLDDGGTTEDLARALERASEAKVEPGKAHEAHDVAFAMALARPGRAPDRVASSPARTLNTPRAATGPTLMAFPDAFRILRSEVATVRVEPPDLIVIEGPAIETRRLSRPSVLLCDAYLVRVYRERHGGTFPAENDEDIVVLLRVEGADDAVLGPFPHGEGVAIAEAVRIARETLLFAAPGLSFRISADLTQLWLTFGGRFSSAIPLPATEIVEIAVREEPDTDAGCTIRTGLTELRDPRFVSVVFARRAPFVLGPLRARDAETIARGFRAFRGLHPLDAEPLDVRHADLLADPVRFHLRRIRVTGEWHHRFEGSRFARAWLREPEGDTSPLGWGTHHVRVVGTWIYPDAAAEHGYGHMGMWPGMLQAETIEIAEAST